METLVKTFATSDALANYLMETCSGDVLEFWLDVEFFKRLEDTKEIKATAKKIYTTYIQPTSPKEVVLDPLVKHQVVRAMFAPDPVCHVEMFNGAQDAIGEVLAARCRLVSSEPIIVKKDKDPDTKSRFFGFKRENTFPKPLSSKLKQYNQTINRERSLINFDVSL